jgi:hypothetical protein
MIGGLYENSVSRKYLSTTLPYYIDDMTWCVGRSNLSPKWKNVFIIFDSSIWILIISIFMLMALIFYYYAKKVRKDQEHLLWSILNALSLTINNFDYLQSRNPLKRIFIAISLFYGIHIGVAYRSSLINVLTSPRYEPQTEDLQTAIANNFSFTGNINILEFLDKSDEVDIQI